MSKRVNVPSTPTALYKNVYVLKREIVCQLLGQCSRRLRSTETEVCRITSWKYS